MNIFGKAMRRIAPEHALRREVARTKLDLLQTRSAEMSGGNHEPVGGGKRSREFRRNSQDAMLSMRGERGPLAYIARDMLRNNPRVVRINHIYANNVIGTGIMPTVTMKSKEDDKNKSIIEGCIEDHLMTNAIDADGINNLPAMQALMMSSIPLSGEVLTRKRDRRASDGLPLPFQLQILETDFLNESVHGERTNGVTLENGIEYGPTGRVQAYHLHQKHPGGAWHTGKTVRIPAEYILHGFRTDRPGQRRGVSWYAPVMTELHDLHKFMSATLKRQEVAAMFAGILKNPNLESNADEDLAAVEAGTIYEVGQDEDLTFNSPPSADNAAPILKMIDSTIAAGCMIPLESMTGDYTGVNYSGGRMGRMDSDPFVARNQSHLMINQKLRPIGMWTKEAIHMKHFIDPDSYRIDWVPQARPVVDPTKDYPAIAKKLDAKLSDRHTEMRKLGLDPVKIDQAILADKKWHEENKIPFMKSKEDPKDGSDEKSQKSKSKDKSDG